MKNFAGGPNLVACFALIVFFFSSCSYKQNQVLFEGGNATGRPADTTTIYRIKPQDVLQIKNMQNVKFIAEDPTAAAASPAGAGGGENQTYLVEPDGTVGLPVLGRIKIAGMTRFEAERKLDDLYGSTLIKNPVMQVTIMNLKVTVMGEVKTPGNYPLIKDETSLVEVLGEAGGLTKEADERTVKIIRGNPKNPDVIIVDLSKLNSMANPAFMMQSRDVIYIARSKKAMRTEKLQNFSLISQPTLLLLNTVLIALTLSKR